MIQTQDSRLPDACAGAEFLPAGENINRTVFYYRKTKYIVTEYYRDKVQLKDAVANILYARYKAEKQKKKDEALIA